jgi:nitroimidazol reductase NimA-like FMN-containing flavoprotein (pyridoxamine 5'-phosphate oxidase superfamily)
MSDLVELPREKCEELLRASIVGRVAFTTAEGPEVVPVNYTTVGDAVVFRTSPYSQLGRQASGTPLAFEIDHIDYDDHKGWSVIAYGVGELVEDTSELQEVTGFWNPKPWAGGARPLYVRLRWKRLSGRRIGGGWTRENELPVRRR